MGTATRAFAAARARSAIVNRLRSHERLSENQKTRLNTGASTALPMVSEDAMSAQPIRLVTALRNTGLALAPAKRPAHGRFLPPPQRPRARSERSYLLPVILAVVLGGGLLLCALFGAP